jgi:arylsulfatase A-like enzyme
MWDVHYDYAPPVPYDRLFDPEYTGKVDGLDFELGWQVHRSMDRRDLEHVIALYDGEIRFTDSHLGRLIGLLRKVDVLDDTIVVVTSDHGDEFFEHGNKGHAKALFDETIRVPLILRYPRRIAPGQVISAQVRLADVAPTILGLAGVPAPAGFGLEEGFAHAERDLTPWLTGAEAPESFPRLLAFGETSRVPPAHRFARSPEGKLILTPAKKRSTKIFDLERDPGEQVNLANPNREPAFAATLKEEADLWMKQFQGKQDLAAPLELDPALEQHLRALGYIQ